MSEKSPYVSRNNIASVWDCGDDLYQQRMPENEPSQDLFSEIHYLFDQQTEKQDQQMHRVISQMVKEFRDHVSTICRHITKTAELQENTIKLYIRQELDLLRQDLTKSTEDHYERNENGQLSSEASFAYDTYHEAEKNPRNIRRIDQMNQDMDHRAEISRQYKQQNGEGNLSDSAYDWRMVEEEESTWVVDGLDKNYGHRDKSGQENHSLASHSREKNNSNRVVHEKQASALYPSDSETDRGAQFGNSPSPAISLTPIKEESIQATGFFAEIIHNQMKQTSSQDKTEIRTADTFKDFSKAVNFEHRREFTFSGSKKLRSFHKFHSSPCIATTSWTARFYVKFNSAQQLTIQVCISRGEYDNNKEWPLKFTAYGYIFQPCSKRFTQIWQLSQVICQKPLPTEEVTFPAEVCLSTTRGSYPDITYNDLEYRGYIQDNKLTFRWTIKAEKH